jgi:hypothetical protein
MALRPSFTLGSKPRGGRSQAAYEGLKHAFSELFKRNEYIHKADESAVKDTIVEITGLKKNDPIVRLMYASFDGVRGFINSSVSKNDSEEEKSETDTPRQPVETDSDRLLIGGGIGLSYQINIVLPETENIGVFNAIFKSLRENLLR